MGAPAASRSPSRAMTASTVPESLLARVTLCSDSTWAGKERHSTTSARATVRTGTSTVRPARGASAGGFSPEQPARQATTSMSGKRMYRMVHAISSRAGLVNVDGVFGDGAFAGKRTYFTEA